MNQYIYIYINTYIYIYTYTCIDGYMHHLYKTKPNISRLYMQQWLVSEILILPRHTYKYIYHISSS